MDSNVFLQNIQKKTMNKIEDNILTGVILAAGKGVRAYPATKKIPKALLEVGGKPLIERNVEIMRDQLNIKKIIIVVGHYGDQIVNYFENKSIGVQFTFVKQKEQKGIGHALLTIEPLIEDEKFFVILADEFYMDSNHYKLLDFMNKETDAVLLFREEKDKNKISNNFTGKIHNNRVMSLIEKPENPDSRLMGVGSYLLNNKVFYYIKNTLPSKLRDEVEITEVLANMAKHEMVCARMLDGIYINVNNTDDLNNANYRLREKNFDRYKISVVIPAYNEAKTIEEVLDEFMAQSSVDEVLVVDNNSTDDTLKLSVAAGARVITENKQGYGCAIKRGLDEAIGEIIILTAADGSFRAEDIPKFLEYLKDSDMVIGTRTTRQMIEQGSNMGPLVRFVSLLYGKIVEVLWWDQEPRFTDVGCTYRAIWKSSYQKIKPYLKTTGSEFDTEMMLALLICKKRIIEIPVSYRKCFGDQLKKLSRLRALVKTAVKLMVIILQYRFVSKKS